jgi:N-acetylglucosaminyldiphosphoundecaprenol N-acetyl-beta-D-mannosaminyltransferase
MDILVGMRLHSHVFAALTGVPMLGISYDPKVAIFLEGLGQNFINVEDVEGNKLFQLFEGIWARKNEIRDALGKRTSELKEKGLKNFEIFFDQFKYYQRSVILGVEFDNINLSEAIEKIEGFIRSGKPHLIVTPNPEMVAYAQKDKDYKSILNSADLRLPDGVGIVLASRMLGENVKERVAGVDLIGALAGHAEAKRYSVYILGSKPGVAREAALALQKKFKDLKIAGTYHGYFSEEEEKKVIENINSTKPHILLVGIGFPKQEKFLAKNILSLKVPVMISVGGGIDVLAGKVRRAPGWMQRTGLEWFYRLLSEPGRFQRMKILPYFIYKVFLSGLKRH